jgi:hypothetical protein
VTKSEKAATTNKKYRIINLPFVPPMRRERITRCNRHLQRFALFREIASRVRKAKVIAPASGTRFETYRDVRRESVMRSKADVRQRLWFCGFTP